MSIITPYKNSNQSKKKQVAEMFNTIAQGYDFMNHFLSLGVDILWRKKAIRVLKEKISGITNFSHLQILDLATGTADFALEAIKMNPEKITGIDISENMIRVGREKIKKRTLENKIELMLADSENLPFENNFFHAITIGFGIRNFENPEKGLLEMFRVLKENGTVVILEFSKPLDFPVKQIYNIYFKNFLPLAGKMFSGNKRAYSYLPESVTAFPHGEEFLKMMRRSGFKNLKQISLSFGIASLYIGEKILDSNLKGLCTKNCTEDQKK